MSLIRLFFNLIILRLMIQRMNELKFIRNNFFHAIADTGQLICKSHFVQPVSFWILNLHNFLIKLWSSDITFYNTRWFWGVAIIYQLLLSGMIIYCIFIISTKKIAVKKCYFFCFIEQLIFTTCGCGDPQFLHFVIAQSSYMFISC